MHLNRKIINSKWFIDVCCITNHKFIDSKSSIPLKLNLTEIPEFIGGLERIIPNNVCKISIVAKWKSISGYDMISSLTNSVFIEDYDKLQSKIVDWIERYEDDIFIDRKRIKSSTFSLDISWLSNVDNTELENKYKYLPKIYWNISYFIKNRRWYSITYDIVDIFNELFPDEKMENKESEEEIEELLLSEIKEYENIYNKKYNMDRDNRIQMLYKYELATLNVFQNWDGKESLKEVPIEILENIIRKVDKEMKDIENKIYKKIL